MIYRKFSKKFKTQNKVEIDKLNDRTSKSSVSNVYEDINYNEFGLQQNIDDSMQPNTYIEILDQINDTIQPNIYLEILDHNNEIK